MAIDITTLNEDELLALNRQIVARLKYLQQKRTDERMIEFHVGDRVCFEPEGQPAQFGVLVRHNRKTVTVLTDGGAQWNVSPALLHRVKDVTPRETDQRPAPGEILPFRRR